MDTFLETVASNAVVAALLAVAVAVATRWVRRPEVAYWLWMLVLVKLVTPPVVHVPLRLGLSSEPASPAAPAAASQQASTHPSGETSPLLPRPGMSGADVRPARGSLLEGAFLTEAAEEGSEIGQPAAATTGVASVEEPVTAGQAAIGLSWREAVIGLWLAGSTCWFALAAIRLFRFGRLIRRADPAPEHLKTAARRLAGQFGLKRCPEIRVLAARVPPLLWRLGRRAVIVLPGELLGQLPKADQTALVAHELAHYRRGDHLIRWAECAILGLYWWHPVVWWARRRLRQAEEQCCDEWVLRAFPESAKRYAHTLLTAVEFLSTRRSALPASASGMGQIGSLRRRLEMILDKSMRRRTSWLGFAAVVMAALVVLPWSARTVPAQATQEKSEPATPAAAPATDTSAAETSVPQTPAPETSAEGPRSADLPSPGQGATGVVLGPDGSPMPGAKVYLRAWERRHPLLSGRLLYSALPVEQEMVEQEMQRRSRPTILRRARTDAAGRFALEMERPEPESSMPALVVASEGLGLAFQTWEPTADEIEIRLREVVPIRGRLLAPDGKPAEGVLVKVVWLRAGESYLSVPDHLAVEDLPEYWPQPVRTDGEGSFTLAAMPAGSTVRLSLSHPDSAPEAVTVDSKLSQKEEDESQDTARLPPTFSHRLGPPRPVEGVVTAADTGEPLAGLLVKVIPMGSRGGRGIYRRTDEKGRYRASGPAATSWYLDVYPRHDSGYLAASARHRGWPEGASRLVMVVKLDRGKIIGGRVLDEQTAKPIAGASVVYRPSKENPARKKDYEFRHPALTDDAGRFALTVPSGLGCLMVETPDRSYLRLPDLDGLVRPRGQGIEWAMPMGLTRVDVPEAGTLAEDVVIRLGRGRTVTLQAVGPKGEPLPSVRAAWDGIDAVHDVIQNHAFDFPEGRVVVAGLDPKRSVRVFMIYPAGKLGAVFDLTPETPEGPVEVRLQPTGTLVGQGLTRDGMPAEDTILTLKFSFNPQVSDYTRDGYLRLKYAFYSNFTGWYGDDDPPHPDGKFKLRHILPGLPLGLVYGRSRYTDENSILTVKPLEPGEQRDLGKLNVDVAPGMPKDFAVGPQPFKEAVWEGGRLEYIQGIPVLFLEGGPEQIGSQYGALLAESMRPVIDLPKAIMGGASAAIWPAVVQVGRGSLDRVPDRYRRELDALAEQGKLTRKEIDTLAALNALFEYRGGGDCTAFLVEPKRSAAGQMLFGRNFDLSSYGCLDRLTLVTVYRPRGRHAFASVGFPGFLGVGSGMNDAGLAVAALAAYESKDDSLDFNPLGTPLYLTFRRVLEECSTIEEAEKLLKGGKYTTRIILAACDTRQAAVFEITPKNVVPRRAEDHLLAATNQFRTPELSVSTDSTRYAKLQKYWGHEEPLTFSDVAQAMKDVGRDDTLQTMIFEPGPRKLHLAIGARPAATERPLVTLNLAELFRHQVAGTPQ